jgi:hypothetical protein
MLGVGGCGILCVLSEKWWRCRDGSGSPRYIKGVRAGGVHIFVPTARFDAQILHIVYIVFQNSAT